MVSLRVTVRVEVSDALTVRNKVRVCLQDSRGDVLR